MAQHEHDEHGSELSETQLRVRALETVLTEKGYIDPAALDLIVQAYETKIGPHTGARVVRISPDGFGGVREDEAPVRLLPGAANGSDDLEEPYGVSELRALRAGRHRWD